jgi:hypothetical protein
MFFFKDAPSKGTIELFKRFTAPVPGKPKEIGCYKLLVFPRARSNVPADSHTDIIAALEDNFTALRTLFVRRGTPQSRITIASSLAHIETVVKNAAPGWAVSTLPPRTELTRAADTVGGSAILIGNHLANLVHMAWLTPNRSVVIDLSPANISCNKWAEEFSGRNGLEYFRLGRDDADCSCATFDCYPNIPKDDEEVDIDRLADTIQQALEWLGQLQPEPTATPAPLPTIDHVRLRPP